MNPEENMPKIRHPELFERLESAKELFDRIIRIESRLVQLGDHVGANLRTKQRIEVVVSATGVAVEVDSMDVSMSRILTELSKRGVKTAMSIPIFCKHKQVGSLLL